MRAVCLFGLQIAVLRPARGLGSIWPLGCHDARGWLSSSASCGVQAFTCNSLAAVWYIDAMEHEINCPDCDYEGEAETRKRADMAFGILLLFICLIPGVIYFVINSGYRDFCPECGAPAD